MKLFFCKQKILWKQFLYICEIFVQPKTWITMEKVYLFNMFVLQNVCRFTK